MRYTLVINGVEFTGQEHPGSATAPQIAAAYLTNLANGGITSLSSDGDSNATLVNWSRVATVRVIVED
jgi:hypothetical protein